MTAGLNLLKYGSAFTWLVRSASWPLSPSERASVNGTVKTVGSVPAASFAANVGPVHWYSTELTLMPGFAFWNSATCAANSCVAAFVLPGISDATLIVTAGVDLTAALEAEPTATASRLAAATARPMRLDVIALMLDFIVLPFVALDGCCRIR